MPEADKPALRRLFVQALSSMGFNDADRIIRKAVEAVPDGGIGEAGMDGDAVEAEAWAYLAVRSLKGLPITFPGTTGVAKPLTGGVLAKA